jgi:hypothetical protein
MRSFELINSDDCARDPADGLLDRRRPPNTARIDDLHEEREILTKIGTSRP